MDKLKLLEQKIEGELASFYQEKMKLTKEQVFYAAREIDSVRDLAGVIICGNFREDDIEKMLTQDDLLNNLYEIWENDDSVLPFMRSTVETYLNSL